MRDSEAVTIAPTGSPRRRTLGASILTALASILSACGGQDSASRSAATAGASAIVSVSGVDCTLPESQSSEKFAAGTGGESDPFLICTTAQLLLVREWPSAHFRLESDLDLKKTPFTPIGDSEDMPFMGGFDGNHHTISQLKITVASSISHSAVGFFGFIRGAEISNLVLADARVQGVDRVGGLVGQADSSVISNIRVTGTVIGEDSVGGLVGIGTDTNLSNSWVDASVTASGQDVGGLVGRLISGSSLGSSITFGKGFGSVFGQDHVGGVLGRAVGLPTSPVRVTLSSAEVDVQGSAYLGGLVGGLEKGLVSNSYSTSILSGTTRLGGIAGTASDSKITQCYATGEINGTTAVGGIVPEVFGSTTQSGNFWAYDSTNVRFGTGISVSAGSGPGIAEKKTDAELKSQATYAGWRFDLNWEMEEGNTYPWIRRQ